jgi:hypothetical protein
MKVLMNELEGVGIRLNQKRPNITIKQRERGGVSLSCLGFRSYAQGILILFVSLAFRNSHGTLDQSRSGRNQSGLFGIQDEQCYHLHPRARLHYRTDH